VIRGEGGGKSSLRGRKGMWGEYIKSKEELRGGLGVGKATTVVGLIQNKKKVHKDKKPRGIEIHKETDR